MALRHWIFVYIADGQPAAGAVHVVDTSASTTVLAGYPSTAAARAGWTDPFGPLARQLARTQLVELCGAFSHADVVALRDRCPDIPIGLVTYSGEMTGGRHAISEN